MDILFLDANVLFSAAYREDSGLRQLWELSKVKLVTSAYAVEEAFRNLEAIDQRKSLEKLLEKVLILRAAPTNRALPPEIELPDKDRPILFAAIDSKATHLVTGDFKHFGKYYGKTVEGVLIVPPADYFKTQEHQRNR